VATVVLDYPDLALVSDPTRRVQIERLTQQTPTREGSEVFVLFEGRQQEVSFRGEMFTTAWQLEATYARDEHQGAADLIALLEDAYAAADGRLILRTRVGQVPGLDPIQIVRVPPTWVREPQPGNIIRVRFNARAVYHTVAV
jgi:hypothetical protein